ncbi:MAG: hypothetical protein BAJATHORv1_10019 [Candidatus Thorarchaeota archaeon]|nr:MAG: hypothetical protein BAJATHORv1_10019 [Candidatus Thorarchaeota archaeon]
MASNWTNKWVLMLLVGIIIQMIFYPLIGILKPTGFIEHEYFYDVVVIGLASVTVQFIGFLVIISKTKNEDPAIYGQGRPFQHKLREEDEEVADRKPTHAE